MGTGLEIFLLGGIDLHYDGIPVTNLVTRKAEALLAYLVCNPRPYSREVLATLLWDDSSQQDALRNLRVLLSSLRRHLKPFVEITRQEVAFNTNSDYWLDVEKFETWMHTVHEQRSFEGRLVPEGAAVLENAVNLYRGDFLEGFYLRGSRGFEEWAIMQRERFQWQMRVALRDLSRFYLSRRNYTDGLEKAAHLLELDPLNEEAHRLMMLLLARSGQRNAALVQYQTCCRIIADELGIDPAPETEQLYRRIGGMHPVKAYNLPLELTQVVGREDELAEISERLENPTCCLLTLLGPGGIGKTWLAAEFARLAAQERADIFLDGLYFVSLAAAGTSELMVYTIAEALRFSFYGKEDPRSQLLSYLRTKEMLLVLDDFEHLTGEDTGGVQFLVEVLRCAPGVCILVTSRHPLNLRAEWLLEIRGLNYPLEEDAVKPEAWSAIQLFRLVAQRVRPRFSLSAEMPHAIRICQLVEGMPLGIELAAAWLRSYTCAEIADRISGNLDFLSTSAQDLPQRHRSLRAAFEHSWQLLSPAEQDVFSWLAVFYGGFSVQAAQGVVDTTLETLNSLVDKSLLRRDSSGRYSMHKLLSQYVSEKLESHPTAWTDVHTQHADFYTSFLEAREDSLLGVDKRRVFAEVQAEIDNVRAAWRWALDQGMESAITRSMEMLYRFYDIQSWFHEGRDRFSQAVVLFDTSIDGSAPPDQDRQVRLGRALMYQGWFLVRLGMYVDARQLLQRSETLLRDAGERGSLAVTLNALGHVTQDNQQRAAFYQESLELHREAGSIPGVVAAHNGLGVVLRAQGRYEEARHALDEAVRLCRELDDLWMLSLVLNSQGILARTQGQYEEARSYYQESRDLKEVLGDRRGLSISLNNLGNVAQALGEYEDARALHQESLSVCKEIGDLAGIARSLNNLGNLAYVTEEYEEAWELHHQSLEIKKDIGDRSASIHSLNQLGNAAIHLGRVEAAGEFFQQALQVALDLGATPLSLSVIVGVAELLMRQGKDSEAVGLLACALANEAMDKNASQRAHRLLEQVQASFPIEEFKAAEEMGQSCSLETVAARILTATNLAEGGLLS